MCKSIFGIKQTCDFRLDSIHIWILKDVNHDNTTIVSWKKNKTKDCYLERTHICIYRAANILHHVLHTLSSPLRLNICQLCYTFDMVDTIYMTSNFLDSNIPIRVHHVFNVDSAYRNMIVIYSLRIRIRRKQFNVDCVRRIWWS